MLGAIFIFFGYATNTELHARLAQGADVATQSENKTNDGFSAASGVVGFLDFRLHVKISQQITHKVRSELFAKLSQLPVVSLVKQRAGDAVFRVMHDAPSLGIICMSLIVQPIFFIFSALLGLWILWSVYGTDSPELVWLGASAIFVTLFITLPFTRWIRRLSHQSRISGSEVVNFTEEGIRNKKVIQSLGTEQQEQEKFALESKRNELKEEQKLEKERKLDLQRFIKLEQAELRKERAEKQRQFLEQIKLEKKIDLFRKREELEIKNLEKYVLSQQRESYEEVQQRIDKIKEMRS